MSQRKKLSVNSTDFDQIKSNLKDFLRGQETFRDYDFEGSALSVLIDILAYNTYYQAFYNNVAANEMFIDSAVKRSSVVSLAKSLGYTPNSITAPTATVNITYALAPSSSVLLPGAQFNTSVDGKIYTFTNTETAQIDLSSEPHISNLKIKEGFLKNISFVVPDQNSNRKYVIPDKNVDISTIKVSVQASQTDTDGISDTWSNATDLATIEKTSKVYFIEENSEGKFQIYFGDDVLGQKLLIGNFINITYLITSGTEANGAGKDDSPTNRSFLFGSSSNVIEVVTPAFGGAPKETIDSIRFKAPLSYSSQNRAVTKSDYSTLVESNFTGFDSVFVFGGEEADPPNYGTVYIALKPSIGTLVTNDTKKTVEDFLKTKSVVSISPKVIEPDYTFLRFQVNVYFDQTKTSLTPDAMSSAIRNSITTNISNNLGKFNKNFSISSLLTSIDATSNAIESSSVSILMEKKILPTDKIVSYYETFGNPIYHPHDGHMSVISSNVFKYNDENNNIIDVYIKDDGYGNLSLFKRENQAEFIVRENIGNVDYSSGKININQLLISSPDDTPYIRIFAEAKNQRYLSKNEKILFNDYVEDPTSIQIISNGVTQITTGSM